MSATLTRETAGSIVQQICQAAVDMSIEGGEVDGLLKIRGLVVDHQISDWTLAKMLDG